MNIDLPADRTARGFTLVKVVLSVGIIAFAFVAILGLLPVGMDLSRQAVDATVCSQIAQQIITEVQQTDFSVLTDTNVKVSTDFLAAPPAPNAPSYFDDQGNRVSATSVSSGNFIYEAGFVVVADTMLPAGVTTKRLATVTVCLLNTKALRTNLVQKDLMKNPDAKKYVILVPDNGR